MREVSKTAFRTGMASRYDRTRQNQQRILIIAVRTHIHHVQEISRGLLCAHEKNVTLFLTKVFQSFSPGN